MAELPVKINDIILDVECKMILKHGPGTTTSIRMEEIPLNPNEEDLRPRCGIFITVIPAGGGESILTGEARMELHSDDLHYNNLIRTKIMELVRDHLNT